MRGAFLAAAALLASAAATTLPRACREGENATLIPGCTPLANDTVITDLTVAPGEYRNFHWAISNYLDMDDEAGNRRTITIEVIPCSGSAHLYVRSLTRPFPTAESHDFSSTKNGEPNSVTLALLRAHFYISVHGVAPPSQQPAEPIRFSIIAKISGGARYPIAGADGALTVENKFTESLLLAADTMEMLVSFVPVPTAAQQYEYRVFTAPNSSTSPCGGAAGAGECVKSTFCGVEASMTPRTSWQAIAYSGANVTVTASGLPQNVEQLFVVVGRPVGVNASAHPELTVVYTATTGTPEYEKEAQLQDDNTILTTLGIVAGVLILLFVIAYIARRRLIVAFQSASRTRKQEEGVDYAELKEQALAREKARAGGRSRSEGGSSSRAAAGEGGTAGGDGSTPATAAAAADPSPDAAAAGVE